MGPSVGRARHGLTVVDILDQRAYERVREDYRRQVIELKRPRRVALGSIMTLVFESFDTVRFQVQEMARVERIATDAGIQAELNVYNRLLPEPGELSATLFIELTTDEELHHWLPRLVGIETAVAFEVPAGEDGVRLVRSVPEATHAEQLTRATETSAVHYVRFPFSPDEVAGFAAGPVSLAAVHPAYRHRTELAEATRVELLGDLEGRTERLSFG